MTNTVNGMNLIILLEGGKELAITATWHAVGVGECEYRFG